MLVPKRCPFASRPRQRWNWSVSGSRCLPAPASSPSPTSTSHSGHSQPIFLLRHALNPPKRSVGERLSPRRCSCTRCVVPTMNICDILNRYSGAVLPRSMAEVIKCETAAAQPFRPSMMESETRVEAFELYVTPFPLRVFVTLRSGTRARRGA